jgi:hypothetical protein
VSLAQGSASGVAVISISTGVRARRLVVIAVVTALVVTACPAGAAPAPASARGRQLERVAVDLVNRPYDRAAARKVFTWLFRADAAGRRFAMARRLGVMYIIFNRRIWGSYQADEGWRPYVGANPHTDHVHFSLSWAGARKQTSYWDGTPVGHDLARG